MAVMLLLTAMLAAQSKRYGIVLNESFENGMPETWAQEYVRGNHAWVVEEGGTFPDGAADGAKRVVLRNGTSQTVGYITRLVTPVINIDTIFDPILTFAYAAERWTGDFDTLKVFYRTSADMEWVEYTNYPFDSHTFGWQRDTIRLTAASATYQIAFQGSDNMGRGIVLDDIQVRSTPNCQKPFDIGVTNLSNDSAILIWNAYFDAIDFHVKVSSTPLTAEQLATEGVKADIADSVMPAMTRSLALRGLTPAKTYYAYVRSQCGNEYSEWSEEYELSTTNTISVPYLMDFNMEYLPGYISRPDTWYFFTTSDKFTPFVNTNTNDLSLSTYSHNGSRVLVFGNGSLLTPIPAGKLAYAVAPSVDNAEIKDLQVSFWAGHNNEDATISKIIVGVMGEQSDISTFEAIDTVEVERRAVWQEYTVKLDSYEGNGKYIALVSNFAEENFIIIDDVRICEVPDCEKARDIKIGFRTASEMTVSWYGSNEAELIWTSEEITDFENIDPTLKIKEAKLTSNPQTLDGIEPWTDGYLYIRNVCEGESGEWSNPVYVRSPEKFDALPDTLNFELVSGNYYVPLQAGGESVINGILVHTNTVDYPHSMKPTTDKLYADAGYSLRMHVFDPGNWAYAVFPELQNVEKCRISFYAITQEYYKGSYFVVGLMKDANDVSTFTPVDTINVTDVWERYMVSFDDYADAGNFIAFYVVHDRMFGDGSSTINNVNMSWLDDMVVEANPDCREPDVFDVQAGDTTALIKWDAVGMDRWEVRVWDKEMEYELLYDPDYDDYVAVDTVDEAQVTITGLQAEGKQYYYSVKPLCGSTAGAWSYPQKFTTQCWGTYKLPYVMNFDDGYKLFSQPEFVVPCLYTVLAEADNSYYPYISSTHYNGSASLQMNFDDDPDAPFYSYVALPLMEESDVRRLSLSFYMESYYVTGAQPGLTVGVMSDPYDINTFVPVATVDNEKKGEWQEFIVNFNDLSGAYEDVHIALKTNGTGSFYYYIDSVVVDYKDDCFKVQWPNVISCTDTSALLSWTGDTETMWDIVVSTEALTPEMASSFMEDGIQPEGAVMYKYNAEENPYNVTGLKDNTQYYFCIRANCGSSVGKWSTVSQFRTACVPMALGDGSIQGFETDGTACWIVGNAEGSESQIPTVSTVWHHSGSRSLRFYNTSSQPTIYAIAPLLDVDSIKKVEMTFWGSSSENYGERFDYSGQIRVGVITSPNDLATFEEIALLDGYMSGQPYRVSFDEYVSDYNGDVGKYIAFFASDFALTNYFYIDDVEFNLIPECPAPVDLKADDITSNSASITWRRGDAPFEVRIAQRQLSIEELNADATEGVKADVANEAHYSAEGLAHNATYFVYVKSSCEEGEWSSPLRFKTSCPAVYPLPYSEDFDSYVHTGTGFNPDCWISHYAGVVTDVEPDYPNIVVAGTGKALYVYVLNATRQSYAVMPEFEESIDKLTLAFDAKENVTTAKQRSVVVGVSRDVSCGDSIAATFEPLDTFILDKQTFVRHLMNLGEYSCKEGRIVFTSCYDLNLTTSDTKQAGGYHLDNVDVYVTPECAHPESFKVTDYTENSIEVSFIEFGSATKWQIKYVESGQDEENAKVMDIDTTGAVIAGLTDVTSYNIWVRSICDEDTSDWNGPITQTTAITPLSAPCTYGFEDAEDNALWQYSQVSGTNEWYIGEAYPKDGTHSLYISNDGGKTAEYEVDGIASYSWAYRTVRLDPGIYTVTFDWLCYGDRTLDIMRAGLVPIMTEFAGGADDVYQADGQTFSLATSASSTPDVWLPLEGTDSDGDQLYKMNGVNTWTQSVSRHVITNEMAGVYKLVFYWKNNTSGGDFPNPSAVVDNISIQFDPCASPTVVEVSEITNNSAVVEWNRIGEATEQYVVFLTSDESLTSPDAASAGDTVFCDTLESTICEVEQLDDNTVYYVFVRSLCGESTYGEWSGSIMFRTDCDAKTIPAFWSFEPGEGDGLRDGYSDKYPIPCCFVQGHDTKTPIGNGTHFPYAYESTNNTKRARTGDYSLYFYYASKTNQGGYIVFPELDADIDTLQISFWMRAGYEGSTGKLTTYNKSTYARSVEVGVMDDPADPTTFRNVRTVVYPYDSEMLPSSSTVDSDPNNEKWWVKQTVSFNGIEGKYIVIKNGITEQSSNTIYIDDVTIEPVVVCETPYDVTVSGIDTDGANVSFKHNNGEKWAVYIAEGDDMSDSLRIDTIYSSDNAWIGGLKPHTEYSITVRQLCDEENCSESSDVVTFVTSAEIRFNEGFTDVRNIPLYWLGSSQEAEDIFAGETMNGETVSFRSLWSRNDDGLGLSSPHQTISLDYFGICGAWLVTPAMSLEGEEKVQLTFDLALTAVGSAASIPENYRGATNKYFMVVVSADGGATWKQEDIVALWANEGFTTYQADYVLDDIPTAGMKYRIDLSEYAGKIIRVGFYAESFNDDAEYDIHLDNVQVNSYVVETPKESICQTCDYESELITVRSEELEVGDNVYEILDVADDDGPDVNSTLTLTVLPMSETLIEDSICAGDTYTKHGFNTSLGGINKIKVPSANQCDSVVVLNLKLIPAVYTTVDTTICQGQEVEWNGKKYDRTIVVTDTLERTDCGCDSIVTFVLEVTPAVEYPLNVTVCHGETYPFAGEMLDSTGTYRGVFETATGCDSIVNLELTVLPDYRQTIRDVLCEGEKYNKHGFTGVVGAGPHTLPLKSVDGCDSTVTLYLTILNGDTTYVEETVTTDELPYEYMDLYYDETTEPGTYTDTLTIDGGEGGCESVIIHTLTVEETTWWQGTSRKELMLTPNPVRIHESVRVHLELTAAEREGLTVQVYSNSGALIRQYEPEDEPITVDGLDAAGVYVVRIVDGLGNVYTGKIIVR